MAADWTPWDLTVSGQFCLLSERAISLPCTQTAIAAWEYCPWCPGWTPGLLIFHLVLSDGHWDPLKRRSLVVHVISFAVMENCIEGSVSASWKQGLISPDLLELKWFTVFLNSNPTKIAWEVFNSWLLWESWGFIAWFFFILFIWISYTAVFPCGLGQKHVSCCFHLKNLEVFCQIMEDACFFNPRACLVWDCKIMTIGPPIVLQKKLF